MAAKNPKTGRGSCPSCGASVVFRTSPTTAKLSFACDECDCAGYADAGGAAAAKWTATIVRAPAAAPAAARAAAPAAAPVATGNGKAKAFSLEGL